MRCITDLEVKGHIRVGLHLIMEQIVPYSRPYLGTHKYCEPFITARMQDL